MRLFRRLTGITVIAVVVVLLGGSVWADPAPSHVVRLAAAPNSAALPCPPTTPSQPCGSSDGFFTGDAHYAELLEYVAGVYYAHLAEYLAAASRPARYDHWMAIHSCEQPDTWSAAGVFGNGLEGGGGLGISNGAWAENGGGEFASAPGQATPDQQMIVANRIYDRYGPGAWGCTAP